MQQLLTDIRSALARFDAGHITASLHDELVRLLREARNVIEEMGHDHQD